MQTIVNFIPQIASKVSIIIRITVEIQCTARTDQLLR